MTLLRADKILDDADQHAQGIAIMVGAMMIIPVMDAIAKYLAVSQAMAPGQVTFYRFFFQLIWSALLVLIVGGAAALRPKRLWLNLVRGFLLAGASLSFFAALKYMPLADAVAIFFVEPFILTAASALLLGERVGWRRWLAIGVGFAGALIVINPSFRAFGPVALLPLLAATLFAAYLILNKTLGSLDTPVVMQYVAGAGGTLMLGAMLGIGAGLGFEAFAPSLPQSGKVWLLVIGLGFLAAFSHLFVVQAFRRAPASLLAPFQYLEIVSATIMGYIVFDDFPGPSKWLGILIIIGSGLFIFWRERRLNLERSALRRSAPRS